jgi:hypothetical protein
MPIFPWVFRFGVRHPCTTVTVRWLLTICDATVRDRAARAGKYNRSAMIQSPVGRSRHAFRLYPCRGASGLILSRAVAKLIWSTATYLFCRRCCNRGQGGARVAAGQSAGECCRADLLLFGDRGNHLAVKPAKRVSPQVKATVSSPLAGSNRLPSPYHKHGYPPQAPWLALMHPRARSECPEAQRFTGTRSTTRSTAMLAKR